MEYVREFKPSPPTSGIIACGVYTAGRRIADIPIEEAGDWAKKSGHVVWI
ncbi:MAG: magnesium transporter, partial [Mesorhizobium sp.]